MESTFLTLLIPWLAALHQQPGALMPCLLWLQEQPLSRSKRRPGRQRALLLLLLLDNVTYTLSVCV